MPSFYGNMRVVYEHTNDSFTILGANESVEDIVFGVRSSALQVLGDRPVDSHVRLLYNQIVCLRFRCCDRLQMEIIHIFTVCRVLQ